MNRITHKIIPLLLCSLLVLTACAVSTNSVPLLLRHTAEQEDTFNKITWDPTTGVVTFDKNMTLTFPNTATKENYHVWPAVTPKFWVPLLHDAVSNTAVYWDGTNKVTLFTTEKYSEQDNAIVIPIKDPRICEQYLNATNCVATSTTLYAFDKDLLHQITQSETKTTQLQGRIIGIGKSGDNIYALSVIQDGTSEHLLLYTIGTDGSMSSQVVENSKIEGDSYLAGNGVWATFADGSFYMWGAKVSATTGTPMYTLVPSLSDGFDVIESATTLEPFGYAAPEPAFYQYKDYLLVVGQTFSFDELTVAAFKDEKLVGFMLITPLDGSESTLTTYDATGKQLKSYTIKVPVQVIVPQP